MMVKNKKLLVFVTLICFFYGAIAQQIESSNKKSSLESSAEQRKDPSAIKADKQSKKINEVVKKNNSNKKGKFIPSEAISEDLAVSFPVDI